MRLFSRQVGDQSGRGGRSQPREQGVLFCCDGCLEQFIAEPEKLLHETGGLIVCPVCLTEKSPALTKKLERDGTILCFCRCPLCMEAFMKNPEYYIRRLEGKEDYSGTFLAASSPE